MVGINYKLVADGTTADTLTVHPEHAAALAGKPESSTLLLRYGTASHLVRLAVSSRLGREEAALSRNAAARLRLPFRSRYEMRFSNNEIRLGPYIGFLLTRNLRHLQQNLRYLTDYMKLYGEIGGTVLAFSLDGLNTRRQTVKGAVYNPKTGKWDRGTYGYPSAFFIKSKMISPSFLEYFESRLGKKVFNNFNFDKWQMYRLLQTEGIREHLPVSKRYGSPEDIRFLLKRYGRVYIKPLSGSRGRSVIRVTKERKGYSLSYRENFANRRHLFAGFGDLRTFLRARLTPKAYIVQQGIALVSAGSRIVDFRLIMAKDEAGRWKKINLFARYGPARSVISNISAGGQAYPGEAALKKLLRLSDPELKRLMEQIHGLGDKVAERMDASGIHCGNMGVDIGVDRDGRLWILEIQHNNPDPSLALDAGDDRSYREVLRHHLLYLKGLSGFAAPQPNGTEREVRNLD